MKRIPAFIAGIVVFIALAAGSYFWATGLIDSIYAYRSPLKDTPPQPGPALNSPATRRVVFVLIDALRFDTSLKPDVMPVLNKLRQQGATAQMHSLPPSFSEPGYSVLLTGAWPDLSDGPAVNLDYDLIPTWTQDNLFSAANRAGLKTAVSGYYWFEKLIPQAAVTSSFYTPGEDQKADRAVVDAALPWLEGNQHQLTLIHIDQVDYAGHYEGGPRDPRWDQAAQRADGLLGEILAKLDLQKDTILIVSDHGQIDAGGHGGPEPINLLEPFVLAGAGVRPGNYGDVQMVDVAPTLAALLGTNLPASTQGQARTEMLNLPNATTSSLPAAEAAQQSQLLQTYARVTGQSVLIPQGPDVSAYQTALKSAHDASQTRERLQRGALALLILLPPLFLILRHRRKTVLWFIGGALIYAALFNLRYAVLDGKSYSLSSVTGATDLIMYAAVTSAIALIIAWLVTSFGLGIFRQSPLSAARAAQGLVAMTIYLMLIPVLVHFAWNGVVVTWTLPEMWTAFIGLLSMIQILILSALGLVLMGVTAMIAGLTNRKRDLNNI
ncbi:MAG TPA: alkaline phosphatase family protein [Anaerolineaceae bacterium]